MVSTSLPHHWVSTQDLVRSHPEKHKHAIHAHQPFNHLYLYVLAYINFFSQNYKKVTFMSGINNLWEIGLFGNDNLDLLWYLSRGATSMCIKWKKYHIPPSLSKSRRCHWSQCVFTLRDKGIFLSGHYPAVTPQQHIKAQNTSQKLTTGKLNQF